MEKRTLAVLFGGVSSEYEVSLRSATSILENLDGEKYRVLPVGITRDGRWLLYTGPAENIAQDTWQLSPEAVPAALLPDRSTHGLAVFAPQGIQTIPLDAVFPVLHGKNGEDGTIQGLLELAGIPYVGCGVLASAGCMDKEFTHSILERGGIAGARYLTVHAREMADLPGVLRKIKESGVPYPLFVKPANAGSSVGISKAHDESEVEAALITALREDAKALLEETIDGIEVECAVMGNGVPVASAYVGEIEPLRELYDYEGKYCDDTTALHIPARLPAGKAEEIRDIAVRAYRAMGCSGLARVDFFVRRTDQKVILNEINTLPGFTSISMYPKLFIASGMEYGALLDKLIDYAVEER